MRLVNRYFIFALFITDFIVAHSYDWGKDKELGISSTLYLAIYTVGTLGSEANASFIFSSGNS